MKKLFIFLLPYILFGGDPVLPDSDNFQQSDVGRSILALQDKPDRGLVSGQIYQITLVQADGIHAQINSSGVGIHINHLGLQWTWTDSEPNTIPPKNHEKEFFILNELPNNFPSEGDRPQFHVVHKFTATANWQTSGTTLYEQKRNGQCTFIVQDPEFLEHNIPSHAFKIGNDTYKLLSFNRYKTMEGETFDGQTLDNFVPYFQSPKLFDQVQSNNRSWFAIGFNGDFRTATLIRNIWLQYQIIFTRQKWDNTLDEVYLQHNQPIAIFTKYES